QAEDGIRDDLVTGVQTLLFRSTVVSNMRLNWRGSVRSHSGVSPGCLLGLRPHCESSSLSARKRSLQVRQSMSGSVNPPTWPEARSEERRVGKEWGAGWQAGRVA